MKVFFDKAFQLGNPFHKIGLVLPYLSITLFVLLLAFLSFKREVINYGVESDFLGTFVPEAINFLNGDPLQVRFHPPLYSIILASIYYITDDWMKSGLILSIIASFAVFISCYEFFRIKFGKISGIGAILALVVSPTFIEYSTEASSDLFFMALFFGGLVFIALAEVKNMAFCWLMAGTLTGAAIVTRTNGIALIGFLLFAITCKGIRISRIKAVMPFIIGILIPIVLWCSFAMYSGSPIFPKYTYRNLALTYFSEGSDRISADSMRKASEGLTSTWQVLTKDPVHIAKTYIRDLIANTKKIFLGEHLLPFPYILLALPGLFVLIFTRFNRFNRILAFNLLGIFLLLNFKAYDNRFFLYLVPFMGAGIASLLTVLFSEAKKKNQNTIISLLVLFLLFSSALSIRQIKNTLDDHSNLSFDSVEASKILTKSNVSKNATVIARKPHLRFYTNSNWKMFPDEESMEDLKSALRGIVDSQPDDGRIYLFYGYAEREFRPKLAILGSLNLNAPWLRRIGWGEENGGWVLYEILPERF